MKRKVTASIQTGKGRKCQMPRRDQEGKPGWKTRRGDADNARRCFLVKHIGYKSQEPKWFLTHTQSTVSHSRILLSPPTREGPHADNREIFSRSGLAAKLSKRAVEFAAHLPHSLANEPITERERELQQHSKQASSVKLNLSVRGNRSTVGPLE